MSSAKYRIVEVTYCDGHKKYDVEENIGWLVNCFDFVAQFNTIEAAEECINRLLASKPKIIKVIKEY